MRILFIIAIFAHIVWCEENQIEPGFEPKTLEAKEWLELSLKIKNDDELLKSIKEDSEKIRSTLIGKYRSELESYIKKISIKSDDDYQSSLQAAISAYEESLKRDSTDSLLKIEALYNLGRLYFEADESDYFLKLNEYSKAHEQGQDIPYPEENFTRTIDVYETLMKNFPDFSLMDNVYYLYGLAMWYEGSFYQAVDTFKKLIEKFPKSRFVEEVWFRLGEFYYDMDEYDEAISAYEVIAKNPSSSFYDKALYKIAWSHFQKDRFKLAIDYFIKVIETTKSTDDMQSEVIRYIVKSFSEQLHIKQAKRKNANKEEELLGMILAKKIIDHFKELKNPPYTREILVETASQLIDEGRIDGAVLALRAIIEINPDYPDNPRISAQIVDTYISAGRLKEARKESEHLISLYDSGSSWYQAAVNDKKSLSYAKEAIRDSLLMLAVYYHQSAKEAKEAGDEKKALAHFKEAFFIYARYINEYKEREDVPKAVFYFAESAYELKHYGEALNAYQLLKDYPLPIPDPFRRDAIYNVVFTFEHVLKEEMAQYRFKEIDFNALTSKQKGKEKEEIPDIGLRYIASIDEFIKLVPDDEQVPALLFHKAAIYYVYGYSEESLDGFLKIVDLYPQSRVASVAGRLLIDEAVAAEQWGRVAELSSRFSSADLGGQSEDFKKMANFGRFKLARATFEEAVSLQKNNQISLSKVKYKEAAEQFTTLLNEDPKSPYADVMLFNAATSIANSGTMTAAIVLYRELYLKHPKSEYAKLARFQEALGLEKMLKFSESAKAYDGIIKEDPSSDAAKDALLNKALLLEAAGESAHAAKAFEEFSKKYRNNPEAPDALLQAANIYKKMGRSDQQIAILERFTKQYSGDESKRAAIIEAKVSLGDTYGELLGKTKSSGLIKQYEKARLFNYSSAVKLYTEGLPPAAAFYAAKAQSILNKPEQDAFRRLGINASSSKGQADQLLAMTKKLGKLSEDNERVIKTYAQPVWNAESLRRIGALYDHLASAIIKAATRCLPEIAAIDESACDEYAVLLEDKAAVLEEKALAAYRQAYEIALSSYDAPAEVIENIQKGLNRLRPGEYQKVGEFIEHGTKGEFYSTGRKLSSGQMASSLHPAEEDPDTGKKAPAETEEEKASEAEKAPVEIEEEKTSEEEKAP